MLGQTIAAIVIKKGMNDKKNEIIQNKEHGFIDVNVDDAINLAVARYLSTDIVYFLRFYPCNFISWFPYGIPPWGRRGF